MHYIIRKAKINDFDEISKLYTELDELHSEKHPDIFIKYECTPRTIEEFSHNINKNENLFIVAEYNQKIIGFSSAYISTSSNFYIFKKRSWVQLSEIIVKKEYEGKGIATNFLKNIKVWAKNKKINRIELQVYSFNQKACKFYQKNNFNELLKKYFIDF